MLNSSSQPMHIVHLTLSYVLSLLLLPISSSFHPSSSILLLWKVLKLLSILCLSQFLFLYSFSYFFFSFHFHSTPYSFFKEIHFTLLFLISIRYYKKELKNMKCRSKNIKDRILTSPKSETFNCGKCLYNEVLLTLYRLK